MPGYSKRFEKMVQSIQQFYQTRDFEDQISIEDSVFLIGQDVVDYGALEIVTAIEFQTMGLIFLKPIELDYQRALVVEMHPDFRRACEEFERPDYWPSRESSIDVYGRPYGEIERFKDLPEIVFKPFPYLSEEIYLLSEERLKKEIETNDYRWLLFRTPYRPDKIIQSEIFMQNLANPDTNPADSINAILDSQNG